MGLARLGIILWTSILWPGAGLAQDDRTPVTWVLNHFPPALILDRPMPGRGFAVEFLRYVERQMTDHRFVYQDASIARTLNLMQLGRPACHPCLLPTPERQSFVLFSRPVFLALPHNVIVLRDQRSRFEPFMTADGTLDLRRLLSGSDFVTTISQRRGFPAAIEAALFDGSYGNRVAFANVDSQTPFRHLAAGWNDYVIGYPEEAQWYVQQLAAPSAPALDYLPITGMPDVVLGHVGCTKGPWGEEIIKQINEIILAAGPRPPWFDAQLRLTEASLGVRLETALMQDEPFGPLP